MKIDKCSYQLTISGSESIVLAYVAIFEARAYAVSISGRSIKYFDSLVEALDYITSHLTVEERQELLLFLRKYGDQNKAK